ncbi:MAG: response regulator [Pseudomonadota bacterium]
MAASVLIVDDEHSIALSVQHLMRREGYDVRVASDGEAALTMMAEQPADVVLLDIMIPKRDGYDVCQTIRGNPEWTATKIVMVSAKGRDIEVEKGLALGADDYLTKPFSTRELAHKVRLMLGDHDG